MYPGLTIHFATAKDIAAIEKLAQEIWPSTYKAILSAEQLQYMMNLNYSTASLEKQLEQHRFLLAELDNELIGFASYGPLDVPGIYRLHKMYIHPKTQGKGIGKSIIDFIVEQLHLQQATALRLSVNRYNKAKQFYEKLGFSVIAEEDIDIGGGFFMNDYVMEKQV